MALVPVDSTNFTVATNAVSTVSFGAGYRSLSVVSLDGGGTVGFRFDTTTSMTFTNNIATAGDVWLLPPTTGASWVHSLVDDDSSDEVAPAFFVELVATNGTCHTAVTAWA